VETRLAMVGGLVCAVALAHIKELTAISMLIMGSLFIIVQSSAAFYRM
jgi:hypothetical protein